MRRLPAFVPAAALVLVTFAAVAPACATVPATPATLVSISAAPTATLVVGSDGQPYGVGANGQGQLTGSGNRAELTALQGLPSGIRATAVSAGFEHSVVIGSDGVPYGTGSNDSGAITGADPSSRTTLTPMSGLPGGIAAAQAHASRWSSGSLIIGSDGIPYVVGGNQFNKLGGSFTTLTPLPGWPSGVKAVDGEITYYALFVVGDDGKLYARGYNEHSQGPGPVGTGSATLVPMPLPIGVEATAVEASDYNTFIIGDDGKAYGQGDNQYGEIGYGNDILTFQEVGTNADPEHSTRMPAGTHVVQIAAGQRHAVLLLSNGRMYGTGERSLGQQPNIDTTSSQFELQEIGGGLAGDITSVVAASYATLAVDNDGIAYGSGSNINGQLGGPVAGYFALHVVAGQLINNVTRPVISGTAQLTKTLTANPGTWSPAPSEFTYQWTADGADIAGATGRTYAPTAERIGDHLAVRVTAKRGRIADGVATSVPTSAVAKGPVLVYTGSKPTVTGTAKSGKTLKISKSASTLRAGFNPDATTLTYRWYRSGSAIGGATSPTYKLSSKDKGRSITVRISGARPSYTTGSYLTKAVKVAK